MKAADAARVAVMVEALNDLPGARKDLKRFKPKVTARRRILRFEFGDSGGYMEKPTWSYRVDLDVETMRKVIDATEKILREELEWLGVKELPTGEKAK